MGGSGISSKGEGGNAVFISRKAGTPIEHWQACDTQLSNKLSAVSAEAACREEKIKSHVCFLKDQLFGRPFPQRVLCVMAESLKELTAMFLLAEEGKVETHWFFLTRLPSFI